MTNNLGGLKPRPVRQPLAAHMFTVPGWGEEPRAGRGADGYDSRVEWRYGEEYRELFAEVPDTFTSSEAARVRGEVGDKQSEAEQEYIQ